MIAVNIHPYPSLSRRLVYHILDHLQDGLMYILFLQLRQIVLQLVGRTGIGWNIRRIFLEPGSTLKKVFKNLGIRNSIGPTIREV